MPQFNLQELLQMKFRDLDNNHFEIQEGFPKAAEYQKFLIKNSIPYHVRFNNKNVMICQIITINGGAVIVTDYSFKQQMELICEVLYPFLEAFATLKGYIHIHIEKDKIRTAKMGTYNIIAAPYVTNRATVPAGHIRTVDGHLDKTYLNGLITLFPALEKVLNADNIGGFATYHADAGKITLHAACLIIGFIRKVNENKLDNDTKTKLYEEIIISLLESKSMLMEDSNFSYDQIQSLEYVISHIKEYTDRTITMKELIKTSKGIHELSADKIRKGIKWVQGKTPNAFAKECKMLEAKRLFKENKTERAVATYLGYTHLTHFERDFKQFFGISIKQYKADLKHNNR